MSVHNASLMMHRLLVQIPAVLGDLWKVKSAEQKTVISVCQAGAAGNVEELQVRQPSTAG